MKRFFRAPVVLSLYLLACCFILPLYAKRSTALAYNTNTPRRLVLILDGVPFDTIEKLRAEGRFKRFTVPARMVATFPSSTNPSLVEILHTENSPGYEDHYYDREQNRLFGNIADRFNGGKFIARTYRQGFDYHAAAALGGMAYVAAPFSTLITAQLDLAAMKRALRNSDAPVFLGYVGATDSLAHLGGEGMLKALLRTLDRTVEELCAEAEQHGGKLEVELLSDHGNRYDNYRHVKLNDALTQAGFNAVKSLKQNGDVVLPRYGLVGSAQLFTFAGEKEAVAAACLKADGLDFALYYQGDNSLALISPSGRARLSHAGERFKYEDLGGDPLRLNAIIETMRANGTFDAAGFADRESWFQATMAHDYIDPVRRAFDAFDMHVKNRADVVVSFQDGWLIGSPFMTTFATMQATHGNLLRGESLGFAMSTRQALPDYVRGSDLHARFGISEAKKMSSHISGLGHCEAGLVLAEALSQ